MKADIKIKSFRLIGEASPSVCGVHGPYYVDGTHGLEIDYDPSDQVVHVRHPASGQECIIPLTAILVMHRKSWQELETERERARARREEEGKPRRGRPPKNREVPPQPRPE